MQHCNDSFGSVPFGSNSSGYQHHLWASWQSPGYWLPSLSMQNYTYCAHWILLWVLYSYGTSSIASSFNIWRYAVITLTEDLLFVFHSTYHGISAQLTSLRHCPSLRYFWSCLHTLPSLFPPDSSLLQLSVSSMLVTSYSWCQGVILNIDLIRIFYIKH